MRTLCEQDCSAEMGMSGPYGNQHYLQGLALQKTSAHGAALLDQVGCSLTVEVPAALHNFLYSVRIAEGLNYCRR